MTRELRDLTTYIDEGGDGDEGLSNTPEGGGDDSSND